MRRNFYQANANVERPYFPYVTLQNKKNTKTTAKIKKITEQKKYYCFAVYQSETIKYCR